MTGGYNGMYRSDSLHDVSACTNSGNEVSPTGNSKQIE